MLNVLSLKSNLKTAHSHPKMHAVHVNFLLGRVLVLVDRHSDIDLLASPLSDIPHEGWKSGVGVCQFFENVVRL